MICPEGHDAELLTRLVKGEPVLVEVRCICQKCGKSYSTTVYGSALRTVEMKKAPEEAGSPKISEVIPIVEE